MSEPDVHAGTGARDNLGQDSPYRVQLNRGFRWLRFMPFLEEAYGRDSFRDTLIRLRITLGVAALLAASMIALDTFIVKAEAHEGIAIWRYGVLGPSLVTAFLATFARDNFRWYRRVMLLLGPVIMTAAVVLVVNIEAQGNQSIFGVLVLALTFICYLVGLPFYAALLTNAVGLAVFVASADAFGLNQAITVYQFIVLLFASVIGATLAYNLEWLQRESWLEKRLLADTAERDGLTGLYNRVRLDTHLDYAWEQGKRDARSIALLMIDVDDFKPFNDEYGHQAGDQTLKQVAGVLAREARRPLDLAARFGGEEFVLVLYDTSHAHAVAVAQRVLQGVRMLGIPHAVSRASDVVTVSIGMAHVTPSPERSVDGLLQLADQGLYVAKDGGRNRVEVMSQAEYAHMQTGWFDRRKLMPM